MKLTVTHLRTVNADMGGAHPSWSFWVLCLASPVAAAAVALVGALVGNETGAGLALLALVVIYGWLFADDRAVRRMRPGRRIAWVVAGLAISAVAVTIVFVVLFALFAFSGDTFD